MKLGRIQSKPDARTLILGDYLEPKLLKLPEREMKETTIVWPMFANDRFNCCTSAAAGHMVHHWTAANCRQVTLSEDDIIRAHAQLTGDHLLERVTMLDALKLWRKSGIGSHRISSFVQAPNAKADELRIMIHLFGAAYVGLDLPRFACGPDPKLWIATPWSVPAQVAPEDSKPEPDNGHCVTAIGYDPDGIHVVTWGQLKVMSWDFYQRFNCEIYAVLSFDWVERDRASPTGFHSSELARDLLEIGRAAVPAG